MGLDNPFALISGIQQEGGGPNPTRGLGCGSGRRKKGEVGMPGPRVPVAAEPAKQVEPEKNPDKLLPQIATIAKPASPAPKPGTPKKAAEKIVVYHGTSDFVVKSIIEKGIIPKPDKRNYDLDFYDDSRGESVFFSKKFDQAANFARWARNNFPTIARCVIFEAEIPADLPMKRDYKAGDEAFYYKGRIEPEWLRAVYFASGEEWDKSRRKWKKKGIRTVAQSEAARREKVKIFVPVLIAQEEKKESPFEKIKGIQEGGPARPGAGLGVGSGRRKLGPDGQPLPRGAAAPPKPEPEKEKPMDISTADKIEMPIRAKDTSFHKSVSSSPMSGEEEMGQKGISRTRKVILADGTRYVFKIPNVPDGKSGKANCLAYNEVSRMLGLEVSPPVARAKMTIRGIQEDGVATKWLENYDPARGNTGNMNVSSVMDLMLVNMVCAATDTHEGNWKVDKAGKVWMVDTDYTFKADYNSTVRLNDLKYRQLDIMNYANSWGSVGGTAFNLKERHVQGLKHLLKNKERLRDFFIREYGRDGVDASIAEERFTAMIFRAEKILGRGRL